VLDECSALGERALLVADMLNIALLLIIVLIILSVAAVNIIGLEAPEVYGTFGLGRYLYVALEARLYPFNAQSCHNGNVE